MMASRACMCFVRTLSSHPLKTSFVQNFKSHYKLSVSVKSFCTKTYILRRNLGSFPNVLFATKTEDLKSLTDQLLKAKVEAAESPKQSSNGDHKTSSSSSPSEEKKKADNFSKKAMKYTFIAFGAIFTGIAGFLVYEWGSPLLDDEGNIVKDEFSDMPIWKAYILRTYKEMMYYDKMIKDPSREKLLPEPLTEPYYQPPYTLVLEMTGVLVHPDWTYQTGWRFKKRPGVDYFLQQVAPPLFEIVIFTSEQGFTAYPILDTLDPNGYIMYRLFRDATRYMNGHHVKDLSCLNRDLSKVIFLDWNEKSFGLQNENALKLKRWTGDDEDRTLYELASLLRTIATSGVEDVRSVLEYYSQFDDPVAVYKENQRKLQEEEQKRFQEEREKKSTLAGAWTGGMFRRR